MKFITQFINWKLGVIAFFMILMGCSAPVSFGNGPGATPSAANSPLGTGGGGSGGGCQLKNVAVPVKIMFVVDTSGSNNSPSMDEGTLACDASTSVCAPATDPNKSFRSGSISAFFAKYQSNTSFSWSLLTFSNDQVQALITSGASSSTPIFSNANAMQTAITQFNIAQDGGDTPYLAALTAVKTALANDPDINSTAATAPLYFIVFLSDGYPTDALNSDGSINQTTLKNSIAAITALAPGRVTLSTAYYGTINDPNAATTLQNLAQAGSGQFVNVDTTSTQTIDIQNLIQVPVGACE